MRRVIKGLFTATICTCMVMITALPVFSEELIVKSCQELIRLATDFQQDLKTVDTMLGVAIDAGNLENIRIYRLKKSAAQKELDAVLKAIDLKECAKTR